MEEELLQKMIQDRDRKIARVKENIENRNDEMAHVRQELTHLRAESSHHRLKNRREVADLSKNRESLRQEMKQLEQEVQNQNGSLHVYADILREAAPDSVDSSYVLRMQAQLCKAMHSMGILEHQMSLVKDGSSKLVRSLKEAINSVVEEKSKIELEFMNQMMAIDNARRHAEEEFKGEMDKETSKLQHIAQPSSPEDPKEEGEGKLSETEMSEYLDELHDAIEEMTEKTKEQLEQIKELKGRSLARSNSAGDLVGDVLANERPPAPEVSDIATTSERDEREHLKTVSVDTRGRFNHSMSKGDETTIDEHPVGKEATDGNGVDAGVQHDGAPPEMANGKGAVEDIGTDAPVQQHDE